MVLLTVSDTVVAGHCVCVALGQLTRQLVVHLHATPRLLPAHQWLHRHHLPRRGHLHGRMRHQTQAQWKGGHQSNEDTSSLIKRVNHSDDYFDEVSLFDQPIFTSSAKDNLLKNAIVE